MDRVVDVIDDAHQLEMAEALLFIARSTFMTGTGSALKVVILKGSWIMSRWADYQAVSLG
jgi:hypothetical protein